MAGPIRSIQGLSRPSWGLSVSSPVAVVRWALERMEWGPCHHGPLAEGCVEMVLGFQRSVNSSSPFPRILNARQPPKKTPHICESLYFGAVFIVSGLGVFSNTGKGY